MLKQFAMSLLFGAAAVAIEYTVAAMSGNELPPEVAPWGPVAVAALRLFKGWLDERRKART